jgi:hypothetical protein
MTEAEQQDFLTTLVPGQGFFITFQELGGAPQELLAKAPDRLDKPVRMVAITLDFGAETPVRMILPSSLTQGPYVTRLRHPADPGEALGQLLAARSTRTDPFEPKTWPARLARGATDLELWENEVSRVLELPLRPDESSVGKGRQREFVAVILRHWVHTTLALQRASVVLPQSHIAAAEDLVDRALVLRLLDEHGDADAFQRLQREGKTRRAAFLEAAKRDSKKDKEKEAAKKEKDATKKESKK